MLFAALATRLELPSDRGPLASLSRDHRLFEGLLEQMGALPVSQLTRREVLIKLQALVKKFTTALQHHIDAENSVLFPEGEARLHDRGVFELSCRGLTDDEREAQLAAEELLRRYPPTEDHEIIRGDGCVLCPSYGESCEGLEREWWSESEWEQLEDHLPSA